MQIVHSLQDGDLHFKNNCTSYNFLKQNLGLHNDFRSAGCLPFYKTSDAATAIQALSEIFILYKDRLQFHLGAIEDDLCIV